MNTLHTHKGRTPIQPQGLRAPAFSTAPEELHGPRLTMCRIRIRAECRTSDVTTCQKWKSPVDRSLGRWHPRMLSSCPGRDPNTNPLGYQRKKRQGQDQWPQAGKGQLWPLLDKEAQWPSTWVTSLPPFSEKSYKQGWGAGRVTHIKASSMATTQWWPPLLVPPP